MHLRLQVFTSLALFPLRVGRGVGATAQFYALMCMSSAEFSAFILCLPALALQLPTAVLLIPDHVLGVIAVPLEDPDPIPVLVFGPVDALEGYFCRACYIRAAAAQNFYHYRQRNQHDPTGDVTHCILESQLQWTYYKEKYSHFRASDLLLHFLRVLLL